MSIFIDMDGVLADFDSAYEQQFGVRPSKVDDNVDWRAVRRIAGFYASLPPMDGMEKLWQHVLPYQPVILTGAPSEVEEAADNKRAWVHKHLGIGAAEAMIVCRSRDKSLHCKTGDVIVDDWDKYRHLWLAKGGLWVLHVSAEQSITELSQIGLG
jgi:5' nucleotidase, deoxy (Pyrimidine), cytosolic type C protein (NT5C)